MTTSSVHPSWTTALATAASYLLVLLVAFVVLFLLPYLVFAVVGT